MFISKPAVRKKERNIFRERDHLGGIFSSKCPRRYQSLSTLLEFFAVFLSPHCAWNVPLHLVFFIRVKNGEDWICNAARTAAEIMTGLASPVHSACLLLSSHIGWRWFLWHWLFCQKRVLSLPPPPPHECNIKVADITSGCESNIFNEITAARVHPVLSRRQLRPRLDERWRVIRNLTGRVQMCDGGNREGGKKWKQSSGGIFSPSFCIREDISYTAWFVLLSKTPWQNVNIHQYFHFGAPQGIPTRRVSCFFCFFFAPRCVTIRRTVGK